MVLAVSNANLRSLSSSWGYVDTTISETTDARACSPRCFDLTWLHSTYVRSAVGSCTSSRLWWTPKRLFLNFKHPKTKGKWWEFESFTRGIIRNTDDFTIFYDQFSWKNMMRHLLIHKRISRVLGELHDLMMVSMGGPWNCDMQRCWVAM